MLRVDGVSVRFPEHTALESVTLEVADGETVCVLGPSGSGKSTLLRTVAGLQRPDRGRVLLEGQDQSGVPAHRRGLGLMFQDHQLFPQRDVGGNIAFGPRMRGADKRQAARRTADLLDLVGLPGAQRRTVDTLSGGEQQRVALARALAPRPRLLMLDEPLGQLDRGLRERLVVELRELFHRLGTSVLAVTHDQSEAFALADRVVVMDEGRVAQSGPPIEVWQRPASAFVARFLGFGNIVQATVRGGTAETDWGAVPVSPDTPEGACTLLVRPTGVRLAPPGEGLRCTVEARTFRGGHGSSVTLLLRPQKGPWLEATCRLRDAPDEGTAVGARFDPEDIVRLARD